ncbi:MAG: hypothetical protein NTV43_18270 [Methylococcales bacterium]|nr:hypothetical protein [Methylococcales bacterium]
MKHIALPAIIAIYFVISGCTAYRPYAQNPFNPTAKIPKTTTSTKNNTGKVSDSTAFRATSLGLAAASRPTPGAIPHGAEIGIAAALLLGSGSTKPAVMAHHANYLIIQMPLSEAENEKAAQIKMGALVEGAVIKSLQPAYQTKIEEYDDHYAFGRVSRPRWIRVNGPYCENWSCQVHGPMPTANALQWEGEIEKIKEPIDGNYYYRYPVLSKQTIGLVKITKEYDDDGFLAGSRHFVQGEEILGFDYEQFYQRISENLPSWVIYHIAITNQAKYPYLLINGKKEEQRPKNL